MSRFYADYLPIEGADLQNGIGMAPPVVRVEVYIPENFSKLYWWIGSDTDHEEVRSPDASVRDLVVDYYREAVLGSIEKFRQQRNLGVVPIVKQSTQLDAGSMLHYSSHYGQETITLRVPEPALLKVVENTEGSGCMLIYYRKDGGYKIAAIPMTKIKKPTPADVIVNKASTLTMGNEAFWQNLSCVQMKIAGDTHVVAMHVKISSDGSASVSNAAASPMQFYNSKNTILGAVEGPAAQWGNAWTPINWDLKTVYDTVGNKVVFGPNNSIVATDNAPWTTSGSPMVVTSTGGRYTHANIDAGPTCNITPFSDGWFSSAQQTLWSSITSTPHIAVLGSYYGPGEGDLNAQYPTGSASVGSGSVSVRNYLNIYSNNGTLDSITTDYVLASGSASYDNPAAIYNSSVTIWDLTATISDAPGSSTASGPSYISQMMGYSLGKEAADNWIYWEDRDTSIWTARSPFGEFNNAESASPQIWAANGKTYICKFLYFDYALGDNRGKIYKDRKEYGSKLVSAIGADTENDVFVILLDIKLSDIKKLK